MVQTGVAPPLDRFYLFVDKSCVIYHNGQIFYFQSVLKYEPYVQEDIKITQKLLSRETALF